MSLEDSLDEFTDMYKQIHQSPRDKYRKPQTSSQVVGWDGREQKKCAKPTCSPRQHMPRKTCPETQFGTVYACVATEASSVRVRFQASHGAAANRETTGNTGADLFSLQRFPQRPARD